AARVEPFADCAGGYFTDLSYLSSSKDRFHGRLSRLFCQTGQRDAGPLEAHSYHVGRRSVPSGPLGEPPWSWVEASLGFRKTAVGFVASAVCRHTLAGIVRVNENARKVRSRAAGHRSLR